jgi:hypothetical protein
MPEILNAKNKKIIVFKHIEADLFNSFPEDIKYNVANAYDIVTYFGYYSRRKAMYSFEKGWITLPNTIEANIQKSKIVPFGGVNFLPEMNVSENIIKVKNSIICVSNDTVRKNVHTLLRALLKVKKKYNINLIIQETSSGGIAKLYSNYIKKLVGRVASYHDLKVIWVNKNSLIARGKIIDMISSSEVLILPSYVEGAARVVGEAHMSGTNVILNKGMKGSTNFSITSSDHEFDSLNHLVDVLENFQFTAFDETQATTFKSSYLSSNNRNEFFIRLASVLSINEDDLLDQNKDIDLVNFLSCHQSNLPRDLTDNPKTDEITSLESMSKFIEYLIGPISKDHLEYATRVHKLMRLGVVKQKILNLGMLLGL